MKLSTLPYFPLRDVTVRSLRAIRHAFRILFSRIGKQRLCPACGFRGAPVRRSGLWPELIAEWELSPEWVRWFDQREGSICASCGSNLRSGQLAQAIIDAIKARTGAAGICLDTLLDDPRVNGLRVAEINSAGTLHPFLAKLPSLRYSEFGSKSATVPSEDMLCLSYADSIFDLVITSETLEHVPDVDVALREIHRVLKPDGLHIFTVPIVWDRPETRQRARLENGKLTCILPPSYHGAPQDNRTDFVVFSEFGADFVERCRRAGFDLSFVRDEANPALVVFIAAKRA